MRFDRTLTLMRSHLPERTALDTLPVLMYHGIGDTPAAHVHPYFVTTTSVLRFEEHMNAIAAAGFRGISLRQAIRRLGGDNASGRAVAITFDDGFADFTIAATILRRHGFSATMFLPTGFIGQTRQGLAGRRHLSWSEISALSADGFDFGSHTVDHSILTELPPNELARQVRDSRDAIEQHVGLTVESFSYPYAFPGHQPSFVRALRSELVAARYQCGVTTRIGRVLPGDDPFFMKRLPVNDFDDERLLLAKLNGAYDWMYWPQQLYKAAISLRTRHHSEIS